MGDQRVTLFLLKPFPCKPYFSHWSEGRSKCSLKILKWFRYLLEGKWWIRRKYLVSCTFRMLIGSSCYAFRWDPGSFIFQPFLPFSCFHFSSYRWFLLVYYRRLSFFEEFPWKLFCIWGSWLKGQRVMSQAWQSFE